MFATLSDSLAHYSLILHIQAKSWQLNHEEIRLNFFHGNQYYKSFYKKNVE